MKCRTCKYWGNEDGNIGTCEVNSQLPIDESISINGRFTYGFDEKTMEIILDQPFRKNSIMTGKNFGCNNWMPIVKVCVASSDRDIELYGDNRLPYDF